MTILQMTRPHLAYDLFKKHTDLNLAGYIPPKRLTILDHEWKSRGLQPPSDPTPDTEEELKSPYLDLSVQIANDFLDYMRLKRRLPKTIPGGMVHHTLGNIGLRIFHKIINCF